MEAQNLFDIPEHFFVIRCDELEQISSAFYGYSISEEGILTELSQIKPGGGNIGETV